jgi:hypothetical protein
MFWIVVLSFPAPAAGMMTPRRLAHHRKPVIASSRPIRSRQTQSGMLPQIGMSYRSCRWREIQ